MIRSLSLYVVVSALACFTSASFGAKLCLDPGHGGSDPGATSCDGAHLEKTNTLNTQLKFRTWLNADTNDTAGGGSWSTVMTRTTDVSVSLQGRCDVSNNNACDRFMSIHNNAFNCSANGTETFSVPNPSSTTADMRNKVHSRMIQAWARVDRGTKTANYYVLVNTNAPAELAELAFIDQSGDDAYCSNATQQDIAAKYHLFAIQNHYGITAYTPNTSTAATYTDDSPADSGSWTVSTSATDKYGADYKFHTTAALSDPASWTLSVPSAGNYDISAWWSVGTNRSTTAPYILPNGSTVSVNQQANGGKWNLLGTVALASGSNTTQLSIWTTTGFVVIADAVKYYGPK
jgi:N-acetylmuramoyl-L-alanine amidase